MKSHSETPQEPPMKKQRVAADERRAKPVKEEYVSGGQSIGTVERGRSKEGWPSGAVLTCFIPFLISYRWIAYWRLIRVWDSLCLDHWKMVPAKRICDSGFAAGYSDFSHSRINQFTSYALITKAAGEGLKVLPSVY